jgi:protein arginine kinase activator
MKCESCNINDATVQVKQVADGMVREVHLCADCAEQSGLQSPAAMVDFIFGAGSPLQVKKQSAQVQKSCPACHMHAADFQKSNRLGCGQCYETFAETLMPMIDNMHRAVRHVGKAPAREAVRSQIESLRVSLQKAINEQAFEDAAEIRDKIKMLESHGGEIDA